jgi:hypothetical protein
LHTEAGIDNMTATQYTDAEIAELQLGWLIREQDAPRQSTSGASARKQEIRRNHRQETERMIQEIEQQQQPTL